MKLITLSFQGIFYDSKLDLLYRCIMYGNNWIHVLVLQHGAIHLKDNKIIIVEFCTPMSPCFAIRVSVQ